MDTGHQTRVFKRIFRNISERGLSQGFVKERNFVQIVTQLEVLSPGLSHFTNFGSVIYEYNIEGEDDYVGRFGENHSTQILKVTHNKAWLTIDNDSCGLNSLFQFRNVLKNHEIRSAYTKGRR